MRFLFVLALALVAFPVFADDPAPPATSIVADDVVITASPAFIDAGDQLIVKDVLGDIVDLITNPRAVGGLALAAAIIALLIKLSKLGALARLLERTGKTWIRPLIAVVLGGAGGLVTALAGGTRDAIGLVAAFVAGAYAGFSASGSVDVLRVALFPDARAKRSADSGALTVVADAAERTALVELAAAGKGITDARAAVAETVGLPPGRRVEALAGLLRSPSGATAPSAGRK
jgi:hypothetical protein